MATESGMEAAPLRSRREGMERVERKLRSEPTGFDLFQAVALLEFLREDREPVGHFANPADEVVRFSVLPSLGFPPSDIASFAPGGEGEPDRITIRPFGLIGSQGVLPLAYTEYVANRVRERDTSLRDFLDLFHHRFTSFLYRAWKKHHFAMQYEEGHSDPLSHHLLDLIGLGVHGAGVPKGISEESLIFYAGILAPPPRGAAGLEGLLEDYFDVPVEVESFVGGWYRLTDHDLCRLGEEAGPQDRLGLGAVAGDEIRDPQARVRLRIGPLSETRYREFLPDGSAFPKLREWVRFYTHDRLEVEVQLILRREESPPLRLGEETSLPLGWTTWLRSRPATEDLDETVLLL